MSKLTLLFGIDGYSIYTGYINKDFLHIGLYLTFDLYMTPFYSGLVHFWM